LQPLFPNQAAKGNKGLAPATNGRGLPAMVHPVDVIVGKRIRLRRSALSISQTELAERLGLTFQQIQKYERGSNRVSCSRLVELSKALDVPIVYFFEDTGSDEGRLFDQLNLRIIPEVRRLVSAFQKIENTQERRLAIALMESMVTGSDR
jgi:transcriptional regulator with XRE-family HTH domain